MSSVLLWPRHEVLQLVIPQLGFPNVGSSNSRGLTNSTATKVIRKLIRQQSIEGKISFDKWLLTAKEIMKWNDSCIQLFWEMLILATFYLNHSSASFSSGKEILSAPQDTASRSSSSYYAHVQNGIDLEYVAIFLVLHVNDMQQRSSSPIVAYDIIWPTNQPQGGGGVGGAAVPGEGVLALESHLAPTSPSSSPPSGGGGGTSKHQQKLKYSSSSSSSAAAASSTALSVTGSMSPKSPKPVSSPSSISATGGNPNNNSNNNNNNNSGNSSPKRGSRTPGRSTANYLHIVRHKIPVILKALCLEESDLSEGNSAPLSPSFSRSHSGSLHSNSGGDGSSISRSNSIDREAAFSNAVSEFSISRKVVDALGLVMCGGQSRDQHISTISLLHPFWSSEVGQVGADLSSTSHLRFSRDIDFCIDSQPTQIYFSELSAWIDLHLSMNDLLYPVSIVPNYASISCSSPTSSRDFSDNQNSFESQKESHGKTQSPTRVLAPLSSLSRFSPTVINNCSVTVQHMVTTGLNRSLSGIRRSRSTSGDSTKVKLPVEGKNPNPAEATLNSLAGEFKNSAQIIDDSNRYGNNQDERMDYNTDSSEPSAKIEEDSDFMKFDLSNDFKFKESFFVDNGMHAVGGVRPDLSLPQLFVNYCTKGSKLYMISPYYSASVNGCSDCDIVIGAVFGAVIVSGCERVRLTVACRKLIVMNCLECEFNVSSLSSSIMIGDCRAIVFGPYNTSFRNLKNHLKMTLLHDLLSQSHQSFEPSSGRNPNNLWATIWDVNSCIEAINSVGSPAGYAIDAMILSSAAVSMPLFPSATATILSPEKFRPVSIPAKQENIPFEACVIAVEQEYLESVRTQQEMVRMLKNQVEALMRESIPKGDAAEGVEGDGEDFADRSPSSLLASSVIARKFTEWLISTEQIQEVFDLIRLDNDKQNSNQ